MILSEDRVSYLSRIVVDGLWNDDLIDYVDDDAAPGWQAIDAACAAVHPLLVTDPSRVPPTD